MSNRPVNLITEFRFTVEIDDMTWGAFTDCTLPTVDLETEDVKEGGLNAFVHTLPGMMKATTITLKNGIASLKSLNNWTIDILQGKITRKSITITMLDLQGKAYISVTLNDAYPKKWTGPQLKSDSNMAAIQSIEFAGGEMTIELQ
jgi:phage tail-like protein